MKDLITHCQPIPFNEAHQSNLYLDQRHQLAQTFNGKLYGIGKSMVEKIAGSGLSFANLRSLFDRFGRNVLADWSSVQPTDKQSSNQKTKSYKVEGNFACHRAILRSIRQRRVDSCASDTHLVELKNCWPRKFFLYLIWLNFYFLDIFIFLYS